jgi:DNA-binding winged helix-turn-helix (wHTH) protein
MIHRFGDFELDEELFELRKAGAPVAIQPQALSALTYLVSHHQRVVTKDELIDATWQGIAVSDGSLSQAIWVARRALGDDAEDQQFIKTIRGRGFRFVAPVTALGTAEPEAAPPAEAPPLSSRFVGRRNERTTIQAAIDDARKGKGGVVFVAGEPGIGKTTLVQQAAADPAPRARSSSRGDAAGRAAARRRSCPGCRWCARCSPRCPPRSCPSSRARSARPSPGSSRSSGRGSAPPFAGT